MARYLIREAHGGETRTVRDGALPYFLNQDPAWVILDTLDDADDASPLYLSKAEGDLRWAKIADLSDPESAEGSLIETAVSGLLTDPGSDPSVVLGATYGRGVSVAAYGATGNGTTDDSAAFRTALAAGQPVYVPPGTYRVSQDGANAWALSLSAGTRLHGPGKLVLAPGTATSVRVLRIGANDVAVDGLTIDGNRAAQSVNEHRHGIIVSGATGVQLTNLTLFGNSGDGIFVTSSADVRIANSRITASTRNGVTLYADATGNLDDVTIVGCHIEADVQAIDSEPEGAGLVTNIRILGNYLRTLGNDYALTVAGASGTFSRGWSVIGNTLIGALYVINNDAPKIIGNTIDARAATTRNGVEALFSSKNVLLADNEILTAADRYGVNMQRSSGLRPVGWKVIGNLIKTLGTAARGINITGVGATLVSGNTIQGVNGEYGVHMQATADLDSLNVIDNSVEGFGVGLYAATFSTFQVRRLRIVGNRVANEEATPVATYGVRLAGTVSQFGTVTVRDNVVASTYTNGVSLGGVTVGPVLTYSRTGESAAAAAHRAALVTLGLVTDATTA